MSWKDLFKEFPDDMVKGAMMGINESLKIFLLLSKTMDKDRLVEVMQKVQSGLNKDLEEIRKEEK